MTTATKTLPAPTVGLQFIVRGTTNKTYTIDRVYRMAGRTHVESMQFGHTDRLRDGYRWETRANWLAHVEAGAYVIL